jgi:hypothetical protein
VAPLAVNGLWKSSITVMRHILARMKTRPKKAGETFSVIPGYSMGLGE